MFFLPLTIHKWRVILLSSIEGNMLLSTDLLQGNTGCTDSQDAGPGADARLGYRAAHSTVSKDILQVGQGSLYPALHRLEYKGWIKSEWGTSENNRRAKFYLLTSAGRKQLKTELETWERLSGAIALVLGQVPETSR